MPTFISPIQNAYRAIDKPVVDQVVTQLIEQGILVKPERYVHTDGIFSARKHSTSQIYYPGELSLLVVPIHTHVEQADWALRQKWLYYTPLFHDPALGVTVYPMPVDQEVNISLQFTDDNLEVLRAMREGLIVHRSLGWYGSMHKAQYTLIPSKDTSELLEQIHERREALHGYNEEYVDWLTKYSDPSLHTVAAGWHKEDVFGVMQIELEGNIDPDIQEIEEFTIGVFSFTLNYKFRYSRISALVTQYPIQVHQQLLTRRFTVLDNFEHSDYAFTDLPIIRGIGAEATAAIKYIRMPSMDNLKLNYFPSGYAPLWTALLSIDDLPIQDNVLCRIDEIEDIAIHPDVLTYFRQEAHSYLTKTYKCPFMLTLHRDEYLMDDRYLTVDENLDVRLTASVNLRHSYRLSLCILINMEALDAPALEALAPYNIATTIVDTVNIISRRSNVPTPINYPMIPKDLTNLAYLRAVSPLIDNTGKEVDPWRTDSRSLTRIPHGVVGFRTVQTAWVTSTRIK